MNTPLITIDDRIDDPVDLGDFLTLNDIGLEEGFAIMHSLATTGEYVGGGGAAVAYTLRVAGRRVA